MYTFCIIDSAVYSGLHSVYCVQYVQCAVQCPVHLYLRPAPAVSGMPKGGEECTVQDSKVHYITLYRHCCIISTAVCSVQCAVCSVQYSMAQFVCGVLQCTVHCVLYIYCAVCSVVNLLCTVYCVLTVHCAVCTVYLLCSVQCCVEHTERSTSSE